MAVTPQLIKELREMTGAGMMDCKKALEATNGNIEDAVIWLRENGLAKAAKKADRVAAEGITNAAKNDKKGILFELNSETDFVVKNDKFGKLVSEITEGLLNNDFSNKEEALKVKLSSGKTVEEACVEATSIIGEKIELRRVDVVPNNDNTVIAIYNHANKRISVMLAFTKGINEEDAYNVAMHVAAMKPQYLSSDQVPQDFIDAELHVIKETTDLSGKPENIAEKIIQGKIDKKLAEISLVEQPFVMDEKQTVGNFVKSKKSDFIEMIRYEVGEGIEKVEVDFAAEVAAQLKG